MVFTANDQSKTWMILLAADQHLLQTKMRDAGYQEVKHIIQAKSSNWSFKFRLRPVNKNQLKWLFFQLQHQQCQTHLGAILKNEMKTGGASYTGVHSCWVFWRFCWLCVKKVSGSPRYLMLKSINLSLSEENREVVVTSRFWFDSVVTSPFWNSIPCG